MPLNAAALDKLNRIVTECTELLDAATAVEQVGMDQGQQLTRDVPAPGYTVDDVDTLDRLLTTATAARDYLTP